MTNANNAVSADAVNPPNLKFRVMEFGVTSYWPKTFAEAKEIADIVMARNGCGMIQEKMDDGQWKTTHRYERWYGLVENTAELAKSLSASQGRILQAIAECDAFIAKEGKRAADLRPASVQNTLDFYIQHKIKLQAKLTSINEGV